jgi:hypothetical protein
LRSGSLMIECFRKQHLWNLLALKYINGINISISPHRTLSISRGIILYREDDLYGCLTFSTIFRLYCCSNVEETVNNLRPVTDKLYHIGRNQAHNFHWR